MVAGALKMNGGIVWACKNYDGGVQSDRDVRAGLLSLARGNSPSTDRKGPDA